MKVIIAGSRGIQDESLVAKAIEESNFVIDEVVCGMSYGVDKVAKEWAEKNGIPLVPFYAHWSTEGRAAGPKRNARMAEYADALIAVWDGRSKGTASMVEEAKKKRLHVFVFEPELDESYVEQPARNDV